MDSSFTSLGPQLVDAQIDGTTLVLDFDRQLDPNNTPSLDFWTVHEDSKSVKLQELEQKSLVGRVIITLESPVDSQSIVTVSYRDLVGDQASDVIQDTDGFDLVSFDDFSVDNQTERSTSELDVLFAEVDGDKVIVAFNRELDDTLPSSAPFRFKANGKKVSIEDAVLDKNGRQLTLLLSRSIRFDEKTKLMYTDAEGDQRDGVLQDAEGNDLSSFNIDVDNVSLQESELQLVSGEADGSVIRLDFDEQLGGTRLSKSVSKLRSTKRRRKSTQPNSFQRMVISRLVSTKVLSLEMIS